MNGLPVLTNDLAAVVRGALRVPLTRISGVARVPDTLRSRTARFHKKASLGLTSQMARNESEGLRRSIQLA